MLQQLVVNFVDFRFDNSIFTLKNRAFEKYHPRKKFKFQQLEENFADFQLINNVFAQKNRGFKKYQPEEKFIFRQLITNFDNFGKIIYLRKYIIN